MNKPIFTYENGHAVCTTRDAMGREFKGEAWCAKEDLDMESKITGLSIAESRAQIAAATAYRNDLRVRLSALKQLYYSMNKSKSFNPKSYENKMLQRQIKLTENDLSIAIHQLAVLKVNLYEYLNGKESFYKQVRDSRNPLIIPKKERIKQALKKSSNA